MDPQRRYHAVLRIYYNGIFLNSKLFPLPSSVMKASSCTYALSLGLSCLAAFSFLIPTSSPAQGIFRRPSPSLDATIEPNAVDVEKLIKKKVRLTVASTSLIYYQSDMNRVLGEMVPGTVVDLVAITDEAYRVRGRAKHGGVSGWMRREDLKSKDPNFHDNLVKMYEREMEIQELIRNREVAIGMTPEEVRQSLGKPSGKYSRTTAQGKEGSFEYIIYENVPQTATGYDRFGRLVQSIVYVKIETGRLSVFFKDGFVSEIEETKGNPLGNGRVKIVPPPIFLY